MSPRSPDSFYAEARLTFHGNLAFFLKRTAGAAQMVRELKEPASIKDVIESCGVPHPEVDRILVNNDPVSFTWVLRNNVSIDVYPVNLIESDDVATRSLQQRGLYRFVADGHLGKLARNLRLLGFDVAYQRYADDRQLLEIMKQEQRALLTRDRRLLMHGVVRDAYCPRSPAPADQTVEVVRRFQIADRIHAFSRCLKCNALLESVEKSAVIEELEPLTRLHYTQFRRCTGCGKIYWRGSHFSRLETLLQQVRSRSEMG